MSDFCAKVSAPGGSYAFTSMFESIREHRFETVTDDVVKLTGQSPTPFCDVVERASG